MAAARVSFLGATFDLGAPLNAIGAAYGQYLFSSMPILKLFRESDKEKPISVPIGAGLTKSGGTGSIIDSIIKAIATNPTVVGIAAVISLALYAPISPTNSN